LGSPSSQIHFSVTLPTFLFLSRISSLFVNEGSVEEMQEREEGQERRRIITQPK
jgi:hypothetical protein